MKVKKLKKLFMKGEEYRNSPVLVLQCNRKIRDFSEYSKIVKSVNEKDVPPCVLYPSPREIPALFDNWDIICISSRKIVPRNDSSGPAIGIGIVNRNVDVHEVTINLIDTLGELFERAGIAMTDRDGDAVDDLIGHGGEADAVIEGLEQFMETLLKDINAEKGKMIIQRK